MPQGIYKRTKPVSKETKRKISLASKGKNNGMFGKKHTEETKERISKNNAKFWLGRELPKEHKQKIGLSNIGKKSSSWKGDKVGYFGLHKWVYKHLGKANHCKHCGLKNKTYHWANKSHQYKRNLEDWIQLCVSCHIKYDTKKGQVPLI